MTVPASTRAHYRASWRTLVLASNAAAIATGAATLSELREHAVAAHKWVTPTADLGEMATCAALASVAYAVSRQKLAGRQAMAPALMILAEMVGEIMNASEPPGPPPLRPRADIDG